MKKTWTVLAGLTLFMACAEQAHEADILPDVPEGAQAVSLSGSPLYQSPAGEVAQAKYDSAKANHEADPHDADALIWFGRWTAYTGDYRRAIHVFTEGLQQHPEDARFYRHRGHRYIIVRIGDRKEIYEIIRRLPPSQELPPQFSLYSSL